MSYHIGIDTINLEPTSRIAHTEYCDNDSIVRRVGEDEFGEWLQMDFYWMANDGLIEWEENGRVTDMGHAEYTEGGVDKRDASECPFHSMDEVYEFDAVEEYGLPSFEDQVQAYEDWHQLRKEDLGDAVVPGGYYKTLVSGAIQAFGWDMLLQAAADPEKFDEVLETIFQRSLFHYRAWAETSIEAFICHDDMVWSSGPFMHPDVYRESIFPRYQKLWQTLKDAGKKVLYCSDGDFTPFLDDVADAGADGFIFEPCMDLDHIVEKFGDTHVIVGSKVDSRTMTFGSKEDIKQQVDETLPLAYECPGFIFAVGNHIPSNVPVEHVEFYIEYLKENWERP